MYVTSHVRLSDVPESPGPNPTTPTQPPMVPTDPQPSGPQPVSGISPLPLASGQPPSNGFGVSSIHQMGMGPGPSITLMHAVGPSNGGQGPWTAEPPMDVINSQQVAPAQIPYQDQNQPDPHEGMPVDSQSRREQSPVLVLTQSGQPPKVIDGPMPPPGQPEMSGPSDSGGKVGLREKRNLAVTPNSIASASTTGPLHNGAPVMKRRRKAYTRLHTSARPLAQGPKLMGDLSFDLTDVFGGDDWLPSSGDLDLSLVITTSTQSPMPAAPPLAPGPGLMGDLSFDMIDMFGTAEDFDFGTDVLELWFNPSDLLHDA